MCISRVGVFELPTGVQRWVGLSVYLYSVEMLKSHEEDKVLEYGSVERAERQFDNHFFDRILTLSQNE